MIVCSIEFDKMDKAFKEINTKLDTISSKQKFAGSIYSDRSDQFVGALQSDRSDQFIGALQSDRSDQFVGALGSERSDKFVGAYKRRGEKFFNEEPPEFHEYSSSLLEAYQSDKANMKPEDVTASAANVKGTTKAAFANLDLQGLGY